MFAAALRHPIPKYRVGSPSLSSKASAVPVEAPEGTEAEAKAPLSSRQVARTVGLPRLSRISRPVNCSIFGMGLNLRSELCDQILHCRRSVFHEHQNDIALPCDFLSRQIFKRGFSCHAGKKAAKHMAYDARLKSIGPAKRFYLTTINLPEPKRRCSQTRTRSG